MNRFATSILALVLAGVGSTALAKPQPVQMTDAQLDNVAAGQLIDVTIIDVLNNNDVRVAIPIQAQIPVNAAVAVLGPATATQLGNLTQRQRVRQ